jgi:protein TonB
MEHNSSLMKMVFTVFIFFIALRCTAQDPLKIKHHLDTARFPKSAITNVMVRSEIESSYPGGSSAWTKFLYENLKYPKRAYKKKIEGIVVVYFVIDHKGTVDSVEAVSGPEKYGLKEEAIRLITISGKWNPAIKNGIPVRSHKKEEIVFKPY